MRKTTEFANIVGVHGEIRPSVLYNWEVIVKYLPGFKNTPDGETHYFASEIAMTIFIDDLNMEKVSSVFVNHLKKGK